MIRITAVFLAAACFGAPVFAESHATGDAEAGGDAFRQCQTCHVVVDGDGNTLAGKSAKTGPNLFGVVGRTAGALEGFRYGKSIVAAGEAGLVWDEEQLVAYMQDPKVFIRGFLDDSKARSKMSFKVRKEEDALNLAAFLATFSPAMEATEGTQGTEATN